MKATIPPAAFLSGCVLFCALWLWLQPFEPSLATSSTPRTAGTPRASIKLDTAVLERYVGRYEGRANFTVDIAIKNGRLYAQSPATVPFEMLATSEREFFLEMSPGIDVTFRVDRAGAVTGFDATTPYGPLSLNRTR